MFTRGSSRGIFISVTKYTEASIETCKAALGKAVVVLCLVEEIVRLLEHEGDLRELLKAKVRAAIIDVNPLHFHRE